MLRRSAGLGLITVVAPDEPVHLNTEGVLPFGYEVPDAAYTYPPPDDGQPIVIDGDDHPPALVALRQTFTRAVKVG